MAHILVVPMKGSVRLRRSFFGWPLEASAPLGPDSVGRFGLRPDGAKGSPALGAGDPLLFGALLCGGS